MCSVKVWIWTKGVILCKSSFDTGSQGGWELWDAAHLVCSFHIAPPPFNSPVKNKQPSPTCLVYLRQHYENQVPSLLPSLLVLLVVFYRILLKFVFSFLVAQFHSWNFSFYTYAEYFAHLCMCKIFCRKRGVKESNQPHTHNSKIPQPFSELKSY